MEQNINLPSWRVYGNYTGDNYGVHALCFEDGQGRTFYFSYNTLVAFRAPLTGLVCRENDWKQTTGKHLNVIQPDKKKRVDAKTFNAMLILAMAEEKNIVLSKAGKGAR